VKLTLAAADAEVRLGMTGTAVLSQPDPGGTGKPSTPVYQVPATAVFHDGSAPAVWVVRHRDSTLELRAVGVRGYTAGSALICAGLIDGDQVVQAGVHTVFAGERVTPVKPLFADETDERGSDEGVAGGPR
jgi:hypothetical protein